MAALRLRSMSGRFSYRLVAAMLLVSLPLMVLLAVLLTSQASASLTEAGEHDGVGNAQSVALRVENWLSERRENLRLIAAAAAESLDNPRHRNRSGRVGRERTMTSCCSRSPTSRGRCWPRRRPEVTVDLAGQDWFGTAAGGQPVTTSLVQRGDHIQWVIAQPIVGGTGQPLGVVIGELNPAALAALLNAEQDQDSVVVAVDAQHQLIYDTAMGDITDDTALLAAGALHTTVDNAATQRASD